ncbi:hypothetical protein ACFLRN_01800 [Thermoproteota archaeon]
MEEKKKKENDNDGFPKMKNMMKGFFTDDMKKDFNDMKDDATKGLKRSFAVLFIIAFGWIIFLSLHSFLWSTNFTFYQNLVITFDSIIVAVLIGIGLIFKVSGLGNITKKFSKLTERFTKTDEN